jgi:hypothetical protein
MACCKIVITKGLLVKFLFLNELSPGGCPGPGVFLIYISIIAVWIELTRQVDLVLFERFRWFWGLTCDFWAENAEENNRNSKGNENSRLELGFAAGPYEAAQAKVVSPFRGWFYVGVMPLLESQPLLRKPPVATMRPSRRWGTRRRVQCKRDECNSSCRQPYKQRDKVGPGWAPCFFRPAVIYGS